MNKAGHLVKLQDDTDEPDANGHVGFEYGYYHAAESVTCRGPQSEKYYSTVETKNMETL